MRLAAASGARVTEPTLPEFVGAAGSYTEARRRQGRRSRSSPYSRIVSMSIWSTPAAPLLDCTLCQASSRMTDALFEVGDNAGGKPGLSPPGYLYRQIM
jgi:hypothetical protein